MPTSDDVRAAYDAAFPEGQGCVLELQRFADGLPGADRVPGRSPAPRRWLMPTGIAAAVAAVAVSTVVLSGPPQSLQIQPGSAGSPASSAAALPTPTAATFVATSAALSSPTAATSPVPPRVPSKGVPSKVLKSSTTGPAIGAVIGGGPLAPYGRPSSYTVLPKGTGVRAPIDSVARSVTGVLRQFSVYISAPSADPKVVDGGYEVIVTAPDFPYLPSPGSASVVPTGAGMVLSGRTWRWNANHSVLISSARDSVLYVGVLSHLALNQLEPTIPAGYSTADILAIASGVRSATE